MSENSINIGHHTIWDVYGCNSQKASFVEPIQQILNTIVSELKLGKVSESYKQFEPIGATGFILLEESHISIHTWPEMGYVAIDVFSCKSFDIKKINDLIKVFFETEQVETKIIERGFVSRLVN